MAVLVDSVPDAVAAASSDPVPRERGAQRFPELMGVIPERAVDEFPRCGSHSYGEFVGQGATRGSGKFDAVSHAAPVGR